jgi:hypothetical protein
MRPVNGLAEHRNIALRLVGLLTIAGASGCAAPFEMYDAAQARAPLDLGCPREAVMRQFTHRRSDIGFQGCGRWIVYNCVWSSNGRAQCFTTARGQLDLPRLDAS